MVQLNPKRKRVKRYLAQRKLHGRFIIVKKKKFFYVTNEYGRIVTRFRAHTYKKVTERFKDRDYKYLTSVTDRNIDRKGRKVPVHQVIINTGQELKFVRGIVTKDMFKKTYRKAYGRYLHVYQRWKFYKGNRVAEVEGNSMARLVKNNKDMQMQRLNAFNNAIQNAPFSPDAYTLLEEKIIYNNARNIDRMAE